ncbi:MAG: hypothetical protein ACXWT1_06895 [Methylobacter sp.]
MDETIHSINSEVTNLSSKEMSDFLLAEYGKLRDEILKRTEIQHQLISLALVATGTFLVMDSVTAKLTYPILALFLSIAWVQSDIRIGQLGMYIREQIEIRFGNNMGWEHFHTPMRDLAGIGSLAHFASRGILCGTQFLTVLISLLTTDFSTLDKVLLCLDSLVIILTIILLGPHKIKLAP